MSFVEGEGTCFREISDKLAKPKTQISYKEPTATTASENHTHTHTHTHTLNPLVMAIRSKCKHPQEREAMSEDSVLHERVSSCQWGGHAGCNTQQ